MDLLALFQIGLPMNTYLQTLKQNLWKRLTTYYPSSSFMHARRTVTHSQLQLCWP